MWSSIYNYAFLYNIVTGGWVTTNRIWKIKFYLFLKIYAYSLRCSLLISLSFYATSHIKLL